MPAIRTQDLERLPHAQLAREAMKMKNRAAREKNKADNFWEALGSYGIGSVAAYGGGRLQGAAQKEWQDMVAKHAEEKGVSEEDAEKALAAQDPRTFMGLQKDFVLGLGFGILGLAVKKKTYNRAFQWAGHGLVAGAAHQLGMDHGYTAAEAEDEEEEEAA